MAKIKATGGIKVTGALRAGIFNEPPAWDTITGSLGTPFESQAFTVTPGATDPDTFPNLNITYSVVSETGLPAGLILNTLTGEISGTPVAVGSDTPSSFTLRAADGEIGANKPGKFDERDFSITVIDDNPPNVSPVAGSIGSVAELTAAALIQITATDPNTVTQSITFSEVGANLTTENLSIDSNGNITGTPPDSGGTRTLNFTVRASTATNSIDVAYSISITDNQDPIWVTAAGLLATVNESEAITAITLAATDDNAVSYFVTSGTFPPGLDLNSVNGEITGTPSNVAEDTTFDFEVTATDTVQLDTTARCFAIRVLNVIANSLRFNDDDLAFLTRTNGTTSDNTRFTFSTWVKRGNLGIDTQILSADDGVDNGDWAILGFDDADRFQFQHRIANVIQYQILSTAVYRDPSAWYHFVLAYDSNEGTANNRVKIYINGVLIAAFDVQTNPASALSGMFGNTSGKITVGRFEDNASQYLDGYLAETYFVDGLALAVTDFGAFDTNGDWQPKEYSGAFGTNGFHLNYAVAPGTGDGGGTDVSGNANHFTDSGLAANDQVPDTPTNNYCVLNAINHTPSLVLKDGNLVETNDVPEVRTIAGTFGLPSTGKWYFEATIAFIATTWAIGFGMVGELFNFQVITSIGLYSGERATWLFNSAASTVMQDTAGIVTNTLSVPGDTDTIQIAYDADAGDFWFGLNNTWNNSGNPSTGTTPTGSLGTGEVLMPASHITMVNGTINSLTFDFGQHGFTFTPPTGFLSLNTKNLPTPTIANPSDHFDTKLYTGNATASTDITGLDFQPDLVWIKNRSQADEHKLVDSVRGATKEWNSDSSNNESTDANGLTAFNVDGFELGIGAGGYNDTGESFIAWCWNESATPGFDIVSYAGTGVAKTEAHSLGAVPDMMIVKALNTTIVHEGIVYHSSNTSAPETDFLLLGTTAATQDALSLWNDTAPTSTTFTVATNGAVNEDTKNYITYLWAGVEGFSKFGSYTGNGDANGPFVWCGFRPAFVMIKSTTSVQNWYLHDAARNSHNVVDGVLHPNTTNAADQFFGDKDFVANGFKIRDTASGHNTSEQTYIFAAFAESPFKTARAR